MKVLTSAAQLNVMIQSHIDGNLAGPYVWHSSVYLHEPDASGCNWNVTINCSGDAVDFDVNIAGYLDDLRRRYVIPDDDPTAISNDQAESRNDGRGA